MTPARNRVTPTGDIVAIPLRGAWTGNRGILHSGREIVRFHASDLWITCELEFRGRWHEQWVPHHYTFLYFHDEAVSFAAGHRPCAECRRDSYNAYRAAWAAGLGGDPPSAKEMNRRCTASGSSPVPIVVGFTRCPGARFPDGTFVMLDPGPAVVVGDHLTRMDARGLRRSTATAARRSGDRHHAARERGRAPRRLRGADRRLGPRRLISSNW